MRSPFVPVVGRTGGFEDEKYVREKIKEVIKINIRLHEFAREGILSTRSLGEFLTIAYQGYEAY